LTASLTGAVEASFADAPERLRVVLGSLVRHLHAFVSEAQVSEDEWRQAIEFLTEAGRLSDDRRQELILLSDVLGVSMLVVGLNHGFGESVTESTVVGPFFVDDSPRYENGSDLAHGAPGEPCEVLGTVTSVSGKPLAGARVDVWQSDDNGLYDIQYDDLAEARARGHLYAGSDGAFRFRTVLPTAYPIPTDGPVGRLLATARRSAMRPAHIHFRIQAEGHETLTTHLFVAGDPHLDADPVFGVKESLVVPFTRTDGVWRVRYDFVVGAIRSARARR
jgi:hydroxyquinol 1,2-dioxygenase